MFRACLDEFSSFVYEAGKLYCNATFDGYSCWPPTIAGHIAKQHCPPAKLSDISRHAFRKCGPNGLWMGRKTNESSAIGWTNYTPCFPQEVRDLFEKVYDDENYAQSKFEIAQTTRYIEIVGFSMSLLALLTSLLIFTMYRSLRNNRTRIHMNLFCAMTVQVIVRLVVYIDQELTRVKSGDQTANSVRGIDNMPYLCEGSYMLLEYANSCMFMWMFIEGLYLHNVVTANSLRDKVSHNLYYFIGCGLPIVVTTIWALVTALHYQKENVKKCWYGYNFLKQYWIIQAPRLAVIVINLIFLLNIMRVLIVKLRRTHSSEIKKVRKAVKAALVLLPLLGITNILNMIEPPLHGKQWKFALWCYTTFFLRSFQGFFIALIYCFLNGEVRQVLRKQYEDHRAIQQVNRQLRASTMQGQKRKSDLPTWLPMQTMKRSKKSTDDNGAAEVNMGAGTSGLHEFEYRKKMRAEKQQPQSFAEVSIKSEEGASASTF